MRRGGSTATRGRSSGTSRGRPGCNRPDFDAPPSADL
ncbi:PE-PGRS family protein [Mycobacterium marinum E11]|nr:PE-PGRS family protein [Mycobacterium marinum E11]